MSALRNRISARLLDGVDLVVDLATLGEYGLEVACESDTGAGRTGCGSGWEALAPRRGRGCDSPAPTRLCDRWS